MEKQNLRITTKTVWILIIGNLFLTIIGAFAKIQHWEYSNFLLSIGIIFFFSAWIIIISDIVMNKIFNKIFWIMSMFILPFIAPIFYLIQRNKLINLGNKL